ncbi:MULTISPECIES: hypothetical protein [Bacillati]|uniref:hypothetical protein n=1 Tax=Bacillati TaxID=1783272 RepID=UPI0011402A89|nr:MULTISPECIES: hypothetical protein [Terrabacteria group]MED3677068.1 hypothetical protein [Bacillus velezensis]
MFFLKKPKKIKNVNPLPFDYNKEKENEDKYENYKDKELELEIRNYFDDLDYSYISKNDSVKKEQIIDLSIELIHLSFIIIRRLSWELEQKKYNAPQNELLTRIISELSDCCHNLPLHVNLFRKDSVDLNTSFELAYALSTFCTIENILNEYHLPSFNLIELVDKLPDLEFIIDR